MFSQYLVINQSTNEMNLAKYSSIRDVLHEGSLKIFHMKCLEETRQSSICLTFNNSWKTNSQTWTEMEKSR